MLTNLAIRRATDPDPEVKHFAGSKILRDNLDPSMALCAFILEAPNKTTINMQMEDEAEADKLINGLKLIFIEAKERVG